MTTVQDGQIISQTVEERDIEMREAAEDSHMEYVGAIDEKEAAKREWQKAVTKDEKERSKFERMREALAQQERVMNVASTHVSAAKGRVDHAFGVINKAKE